MAINEANMVAEELVDLATEEAFNAIEEEYRPSSEQVIQAAKNLTDYAQFLQYQYGSVMQQMANVNRAEEQDILAFSREYVKSEQDYIELMQKVFNFQNLVNEFLGQKIMMTFVAISNNSGKVQLWNMENSVKDLSIDSSSKGHGITGRINSITKIKNAGGKKMIDSSYDKDDKKTLDNTFQEVWQRFRISKNKLKLNGAGFVLWKISQDWDGMYVSSAGPLGEAYLAFFLNKYVFSNMIEPSVKDFMTNEKFGVNQVDNESGFLKGDIEKGAAQFGAKARGAQPLSYVEIINYARDIQNVADVKTFLLNLKDDLHKKRVQNMTKPLSNFIQSEYDALLAPLESRLNNIGASYGDKVFVERFPKS